MTTFAEPAADRSTSFRLLVLVGGLVVVAALARLVFLALHPPVDHHLYEYDEMTAIRTTWWVTHLGLAGPGFPIAFAGFGALIVALCRRTGPGLRTAVAGALLAGAGGLSAGLGFAAEGVVWAYLTDPAVISPEAGRRAFAGLEENPALIDGPILGGFALLALGVLLLMAALWRSGAVPRWVPVAGAVVTLLAQAPWPDALRAVPGVLDTAVLIGVTLLVIRRLRP